MEEASTSAYASGDTSEASAVSVGEKSAGDKRRYLYAIAVLLLLLLLLCGFYIAFRSSSAARHGRSRDDTSAPVYLAASKAVPTTSPTTTTTKRPASTGYGHMVCTFGHGGHTAAMLPIKEEICDIIVFTHVFVVNGTIVSMTENVPYEVFIKTAKQYKNNTDTSFGLSFSPHMLREILAGEEDAAKSASAFVQPAKELFPGTGLSAVGVMGIVRKAKDFVHDPKLRAWFKVLSSFAKGLANGTLFLGLKMKDKSNDLASDKKLAKDVLQTAKHMGVKLLVLVTHNVEDMGKSSCATVPVSSWSAKVYKDPTKPALEHIFKFLQNGLKGEKTLEVALSSTLVFMGFWMEQAVTKPFRFGAKCEANFPQQFVAHCLREVPNEQKDSDSLTATAFNRTALFSFETSETIEAKMRRFVMPLDDKVFRRVGWAFFDLAYEIYDRSLCAVNTASPLFPRLAVGKAVLDENRDRKFP